MRDVDCTFILESFSVEDIPYDSIKCFLAFSRHFATKEVLQEVEIYKRFIFNLKQILKVYQPWYICHNRQEAMTNQRTPAPAQQQ